MIEITPALNALVQNSSEATQHASLTVEDLLTGKTINRPPAQASVTFKRAPKAPTKAEQPRPLDFAADDDQPE